MGINVGRIVQPIVGSFNDFTFSTPDAAILVGSEFVTGVLVACIPTLGPVFSPERFRSKYYVWSSNKAPRQPKPCRRAHKDSTYDYPETGATRTNKFKTRRFQKLDEESADHESELELRRPHKDDFAGTPTRTAGKAEAVPHLEDACRREGSAIGIRTELSVFSSARGNEVVGK